MQKIECGRCGNIFNLKDIFIDEITDIRLCPKCGAKLPEMELKEEKSEKKKFLSKNKR